MPKLTYEQTITPTLLRRFELEGAEEDGTGQHCGIILQDNGGIVVHNPYSPMPASHQIMWAQDMLWRLNKELHFDGAWVVCFTHPLRSQAPIIMMEADTAEYRRVCFVWLDKDGDPQFTWDWLHGVLSDLFDFAAVMASGPHWVMAQLEHAHRLWQMSQQVLDHREGETYKRAKGQQASSARH